MNIDLQKMVPSLSCSSSIGELKYFKQLNIYETINCKSYVYHENNLCDEIYNDNRKIEICKVESTTPILNIVSSKIIGTIEGTSVEGQHLTGKKLVIVGELNLSLIITYSIRGDRCKKTVAKLKIPFSTFIIIPQNICNDDKVYLRYLIEDVSIANLGKGKAMVSITTLIQYLDEY